MIPPLAVAVAGQPTDRTPVWVMRQAGRHLPEYRRLRARIPFGEAVSRPEVAAEISLQPIERYGMDGAVIFADIMTPLQAMGVEIDFAPGPRLRPHTLGEIARLPAFDPERVWFVAETIERVRKEAPAETAVIGFAGAPFTLAAYLLQGGGSKDFNVARAAVRRHPRLAVFALENLANSMSAYLQLQARAGADVVQLFDSWAGLTHRGGFASLVAPAAADTLRGLECPTIYFAPHAPHTLDLQAAVGASCYGLDWRRSLDDAWAAVGAPAVQGNLDPAVLLTDPETIHAEVGTILEAAAGRPGHIFNLGHGIDPNTPPEHVQAMVTAVRR